MVDLRALYHLRHALEIHAIPYREYLSLPLCIACQQQLIAQYAYDVTTADLHMFMGFHIYKSKSEDCFLCNTAGVKVYG